MSAETAPIQETTESAEEEALSFDRMPLSSDVRKSLDEMGYEKPTPVQAAVFDVAISGRDAIVQARTGTGKTTAFGLPLVERLVEGGGGAQALVLCPTRELALQVSREIDRLGKHRGVTTVAVYGGASMGKQIDQIKSGAQIVCGTPGRTLDHMRRRTLDAKAIKTLVLDESDEMLSMGFERELTAIMEHLPEDRQTLLFSATLPPDTERLAKSKLTDPELVILSGDHIGALEVVHYVYMVTSDKIGAMKQVLEAEDPESAVIFCNTKEMTERLAGALQREGYEADWLNGDLPQNEREVVMRKTREGKLRFLVATDVAARGIDISHLTHVINFDFPQDAEAYVHRTGRTGRAGKTGTALSLVTPQDIGALYILRLTYKIRPIERQLPTRLEQRTRLEADIVSSLASTFVPRGQSAEHRALARRLLTHEDAEALVAGILREHLSTNPELPELSQSRRRAKTPPAAEKPPTRSTKKKSERRSRRGGDEDDTSKPRRRSKRRGRDTDEGDEPEQASAGGGEDTKREDDEASSKNEGKTRSKRRRRTRSTSSDSDGGHDETSKDDGAAEASGDGRDDGASDAGDDGRIELHVDAGRRDGARVQVLKSILVDGGVSLDNVFRVRVRERYSFIEVDVGARDAAIDALNGSKIGEHEIVATVSQRSSSS
jgi:ATP-dependent RNA helicase DeaD